MLCLPVRRVGCALTLPDDRIVSVSLCLPAPAHLFLLWLDDSTIPQPVLSSVWRLTLDHIF